MRLDKRENGCLFDIFDINFCVFIIVYKCIIEGLDIVIYYISLKSFNSSDLL